MFKLRATVLALALGLLSFGGYADDGQKPAEKSADKPAAKVAKDEKKKEEKTDQKGGNCLTRFWVHTVGGSIGSGLKSGAHKIAKAFD
jgi:homospermidine synthase